MAGTPAASILQPVRRFVVPVLLSAVFFLTAGSAGALTRDAGDGTLSVRDGDGLVWVGATGALVGRFDKGSVRVFDPADGDPLDVTVWGADRVRDLTDTTTVYSGADVRFRVIGRFRVRVVATGADVAAVGQGKFALRGDGGTFSVNGGTRQPLPDILTPFTLGS